METWPVFLHVMAWQRVAFAVKSWLEILVSILVWLRLSHNFRFLVGKSRVLGFACARTTRNRVFHTNQSGHRKMAQRLESKILKNKL